MRTDLSATRIAAWNIRAGGGRRVDGIFGQLVAWAPDCIVLSEFRATAPSQRLAQLLHAAGWTEQRTTTDATTPARNGLLVASQVPLRRAGLRGQRPASDRWLALHVRDAPPFAVAAMHVPNRVSGRKEDFHARVLAVARRWRPGAALLIGDTNSGKIGIDEESPAFNRREDSWMSDLAAAGWQDAFRALHGDRREFTWFSPNGGNGFRLDQAFCNSRLLPRLRSFRHCWGASSTDARRDALSDHAALLLDFE